MKSVKKFIVITLFPDMFEGVLNSSMMWKAKKDGLVEFEIIDLRQFGIGPRKTVDDTVYGGGDGMLLKIEPLLSALEHANSLLKDAKIVLMSPSKKVWNQELAREYALSNNNYIIICGHYEGCDARIEQFIDEKISIGQYILTGGELPAMVFIDSITRLIPGVLGGKESAEIESYSAGDNLEFPQYTRPEEYNDMKVPEVLLTGNHKKIAQWREDNSLT